MNLEWDTVIYFRNTKSDGDDEEKTKLIVEMRGHKFFDKIT